jgi:hypothetical protein
MRKLMPGSRTVGLAAVVSLAALAGCASTVGTVLNRPVAEDSVGGVLSTVSLAADRRTVLIVTQPDSKNRGRFCAEPPPDTATSLKTDLDASVVAKAVQARLDVDAKLKDKLTTDVHVLADRTAALDVFRTGVYALCQFYLNDAISREDVRPIFEKLIGVFVATQTAARPGQ